MPTSENQMSIDGLERLYQQARAYVDQSGVEELNWQESLRPEDVTEADFLREAAWVIMCCGFRESTVRRLFGSVSICFWDWHSAQDIVVRRDRCVRAATMVFANSRKLEAICEIANVVATHTFQRIKEDLLGDPIPVLRELPFIGPITVYHLAKNLGFNYAKQDRHLARLASLFGFEGASDLCAHLSLKSGDRLATVDLVLWRYCADVGTGGIFQYASTSTDVEISRQALNGAGPRPGGEGRR